MEKFQDEGCGVRRKLIVVWLWALLASLLSYSFDLECLVEVHSCAQSATLHESTPGVVQSILSQAPLAVALLPTSPDYRIPTPHFTSLLPHYWTKREAPQSFTFFIPLGLRAPPSA